MTLDDANLMAYNRAVTDICYDCYRDQDEAQSYVDMLNLLCEQINHNDYGKWHVNKETEDDRSYYWVSRGEP